MNGKSLEQLIVDLKESLEREIGELRRELRERLDRLETRVTVISFDISGIHRSLDESRRRELESGGTREGQLRAIEDLTARVTRLEQRLEGKQ